jgi:hypothetical protein
LSPGEPAWVDGTKTLYIGKTGGGVEAIAGDGAGYVKTSNLWVNARNFGTKGDLVTSRVDHQTQAYISGSDDTAALQAALNYAGSLVSSDLTLEFEGNVVCYVPFGITGKYRLTAQLKIPPNVIFHCEGFIYNFLSDPHQPMIWGDRHSHCRKLQVHCNGKAGVDWGRVGSDPCASNLESLVIWNVGVDFNPSEPTNRQKCGLRLYGLDFRIGHVWVKGGNIGIHGSGASDVLSANLFLIGCANGMQLQNGEQWSCPSICIDTNITSGINIDNCNNIELKARAFIDSDTYGTPMQYGVVIGRYTGSRLNTNIEIEYAAQSTGGYGIEVGKVESFKGKFYLTNSRTYSQNGTGATSHWTPTSTGALLPHDIGRFYYLNNGVPAENAAAAVKYTGNYGRYVDIDVYLDDGIPLSEGTIYGQLRGHFPSSTVKYPIDGNTSPGQVTATASEAITANSLVNIVANGQIRNASASAGIPADGFVRVTVASGQQTIVYLLTGIVFTPLVEANTVLTAGADYFLSTVNGRISASTVDQNSGYLHQRIGKAINSTTLIFRPSDSILKS